MQNDRNFDPESVPGLSTEARKAVNTAFRAMSAWRAEAAKHSEKNIEDVIEKMAAAARALGWPERIVEVARDQMQSIAKMQIQLMDYMMDAWEEQIKSPNPSALLSRLNSLTSFSAAGSSSKAGSFPMPTLNPFEAYMQFAEQWQKAWANATAMWTRGASNR
jgi:hypothetical protein